MGNYFHTKNMKIFSLGLATLATAQQWTYFDENVPCDQFNQKFEKIKGMTAKCSANKGPIKKKWRCHLKCSNGNPNVFSVKPIKCKSKGGVPKWRPSKIKDPEALCDDKDRCDGLKSQYNVSNKLLTWEKSRVSERQVRYDFACKDWTFLFLLSLTVFLFFTLFSFGFFVKVFFALSFLFYIGTVFFGCSTITGAV